ncbi:putative hypoxanthine phosphoribosyltransferase [Arabidopsis thaliana]|jgi:hypoxanthine phosphoribosyltransferase|uniref:Hypoxanthine phosphoribosyltransferase n=4 Tax=Arabidopsis TaxID=3701 RepID=A0A178WFM2_ARATH|nr:Hypoxanthine-guanine phosphoribosyltransferase [Arabidopsis thaliana]KAG7659233.1 Phosphoribosyltransferase-like [Arabidopsis suecica]AAM67223.1 hypoxanthine ribosyl transferase, putative [Arabidopsis thaliana]ABF58962.1 At1g71750 [Arabidopsis thaliana]AEE35226.1 Hypoxanthine-guanine phosphoribosyltransferase [Arabidopsis thaliana]OAP16335.1 HGPT [Arabidopsis thaliana]|eukprot:NP_177320.1 Hypoxanthine-guanine phosphoribosyltransferase [Arabidopsis thaliana]
MALEKHIEKVLFSDEVIAHRVNQLGIDITSDFSGDSEETPIFVGVATGACLFLADLVRRIDLPIAIDFIRAESYGSGTVSSGVPRVSFDLKLDITNKHVVLVEDIVDTGNTLSCLIEHMKAKKASSVSVCTLLDKPSRRKVHYKLVGKGKFYSGFECPDEFVVGYGMDFAEQYRNLSYIGVLKPEYYM